MVVGLLHPGEMGAALGAALARRGVTVVWASEDRSNATSERATTAGLEDVGSIRQLAHRSDVIVSVCPPHAAADVAESVAGFRGIFVDANAIAPETVLVKEALMIMTRAKSGSLSVVNARGKLAGVFTDGDLRRRIASEDNVLAQPLARVMTRNPIAVRDDALAVEALKIFDQRNIDDLIVVNARKEPVGLVDSQDLPKWKLM